MYKKALTVEAILQGLFLVPMLFMGLASLLNRSGEFIVGFMILLFLIGVIQAISGLYWGLIKGERLRLRYLIFCSIYIGLSMLAILFLSNIFFVGEDIFFFVWVVLLPLCVALWYWAMTIRDARHPEDFLKNRQEMHYSDILDQ